MSPSRVIAGLEQHARERGAETAVREVGAGGPGRAFTWSELHRAVGSLAARLEGGDGALLVCGGNRYEVLVAILAGLHAGRRVAPCAGESTAHELRALAREVDARVAVAASTALEQLADSVAERIALEDVARAEAPSTPPSGTGDGEILLRSSGTTGPPKVVRRTAAALDAVGTGCRQAMAIDERDAMLLAIPVYHSYGIDMAVLTGVAAGARLELHERFDVASVRRALHERELSVLPAVPVMFDALARGAGDAAAPRALRVAVSAGSPLPRAVADRFQQAFGVPLCQIYGATEFGSVAFNGPQLWPDPGAYRPECVGRPFPGAEIRVVEGDDPGRPCAAGVEGQVAVSSPSMLAEYLGDAAPPTRDGFLLTGDLGRLDEDGILELTGRLKLMIDVGGLKVNPLEVEAVLVEHPGVSDAVVVPIAYSDTASRLKAIVIPAPGATPTRDELRRFAGERLIHYKVPRSIEITNEVPRSPTGKILRQQLISSAAAAEAS